MYVIMVWQAILLSYIKGDELLPSEVKLELGPPRSRSQKPPHYYNYQRRAA
jgi:hypothetical protein